MACAVLSTDVRPVVRLSAPDHVLEETREVSCLQGADPNYLLVTLKDADGEEVRFPITPTIAALLRAALALADLPGCVSPH